MPNPTDARDPIRRTPTTNTPGACVLRKTITPDCRRNRGDVPCMQIVSDAVSEALGQYMRVSEFDDEIYFHIVVAVERRTADAD